MLSKTSLFRLLSNLRSYTTLAAANLQVFGAPVLDKSITPVNQVKVKTIDDLPGPKGLPLVGTALQYVVNWNGLSFDKMFEAYNKRYKEYGPIYKECYGPVTIVVVSDFNEYNKIIRADGKTPKRIPLEPLLTYRTRNGLDAGMVNGNGETWYKYRTSINRKMLRPVEVTQYIGSMDEVAKDLTHKIAHTTDKTDKISDLNSLLFRWSLESVSTFMLDTRLGTLSSTPNPETELAIENIVGLFKCMQKLMYSLPWYKHIRTPMWRRFENHCKIAMSSSLKIINQRLDELNSKGPITGDKRQSLVSYMLAGQGLSNFEISFMLVELMVGSVETTANALMWTLYNLCTNPHDQMQLYREVMEVVGDNPDTPITQDMLNKMKYMKACVKESLRLYPVTFATSRLLNEDIEVFNYKIPAGTHVQANVATLCRDSNTFPDPDQFKPQRWLEGRKEPMGVANLVWGHGARMCIGRRLAEQEMYLALTRIIQKYHVFYPSSAAPDPVLHTVMTSREPMNMKFIPREDNSSR